MNAHIRNGTVYANTARFDTGRALTEDQMRHLAPSIFAEAPHTSRSERFRAVPTIEVLRALNKEGFMPVGVKQSVARDADRKEFTKHLIRLRRMDNVEAYRVGDTVCEMLLKNANDGTSAFDLMAGLFRIPRRQDDTKRDLWTTFNVVQENVIRGGITGTARLPGARPRRVTTRAVNGIDQDVKLNKALWVLAERMAQLKTAA